MSILNTINLPNTVQMAWEEPYITAGLNMKSIASAPKGIVAGFNVVTTGSGFGVSIQVDPTLGLSIANILETTPPGSFYSITVVQQANLTLDLTAQAGTTIYVALNATYAIGTASSAAIQVVDAAQFGINPDLLSVAKITVPLTGPIPQLNINQGYRDVSGDFLPDPAIGHYNLINNSDFEATTDGWLNNGFTSATASTDVSFSGNYSFKLFQSSVGTPNVMSAPMAVIPGELYRASAYLSTGSSGGVVGGTGAQFQVNWFDSLGAQIGTPVNIEAPFLGTSTPWVLVKNEIAAPAGALTATVSIFFNNSSGTLYVDDVGFATYDNQTIMRSAVFGGSGVIADQWHYHSAGGLAYVGPSPLWADGTSIPSGSIESAISAIPGTLGTTAGAAKLGFTPAGGAIDLTQTRLDNAINQLDTTKGSLAHINTWTAANIFAPAVGNVVAVAATGVGTGAGGTFNGGATNGNGAVGTGVGTGRGLVGLGAGAGIAFLSNGAGVYGEGATSSSGGYFIGGATSGAGLIAKGTGTGNGVSGNGGSSGTEGTNGTNNSGVGGFFFGGGTGPAVVGIGGGNAADSGVANAATLLPTPVVGGLFIGGSGTFGGDAINAFAQGNNQSRNGIYAVGNSPNTGSITGGTGGSFQGGSSTATGSGGNGVYAVGGAKGGGFFLTDGFGVYGLGGGTNGTGLAGQGVGIGGGVSATGGASGAPVSGGTTGPGGRFTGGGTGAGIIGFGNVNTTDNSAGGPTSLQPGPSTGGVFYGGAGTLGGDGLNVYAQGTNNARTGIMAVGNSPSTASQPAGVGGTFYGGMPTGATSGGGSGVNSTGGNGSLSGSGLANSGGDGTDSFGGSGGPGGNGGVGLFAFGGTAGAGGFDGDGVQGLGGGTTGNGVVGTGPLSAYAESANVTKTGLVGVGNAATNPSTAPVVLTGTVTFTGSSFAVTGSGTTFLAHVQAGQFIKTQAGAYNTFQQVLVVNSDTSLTLTSPWGGSTTSTTAVVTFFPEQISEAGVLALGGTSGYGVAADSKGTYSIGMLGNATIAHASGRRMRKVISAFDAKISFQNDASPVGYPYPSNAVPYIQDLLSGGLAPRLLVPLYSSSSDAIATLYGQIYLPPNASIQQVSLGFNIQTNPLSLMRLCVAQYAVNNLGATVTSEWSIAGEALNLPVYGGIVLPLLPPNVNVFTLSPTNQYFPNSGSPTVSPGRWGLTSDSPPTDFNPQFPASATSTSDTYLLWTLFLRNDSSNPESDFTFMYLAIDYTMKDIITA